ncbi:hypothetical protein BS50DRAFT_170155 [Corynespora cassiicola Philippines]|uniref:C2H2-type domain-containing protein n=1 Tax=Corynespora cassiicola Philippines TaxID=1448308 RepID=A0A2T2P666_CORCC|nr:hypothetical protein BS50DRAFT_170155 [Corynespora cassiicola Philippines]
MCMFIKLEFTCKWSFERKRPLTTIQPGAQSETVQSKADIPPSKGYLPNPEPSFSSAKTDSGCSSRSRSYSFRLSLSIARKPIARMFRRPFSTQNESHIGSQAPMTFQEIDGTSCLAELPGHSCQELPGDVGFCWSGYSALPQDLPSSQHGYTNGSPDPSDSLTSPCTHSPVSSLSSFEMQANQFQQQGEYTDLDISPMTVKSTSFDDFSKSPSVNQHQHSLSLVTPRLDIASTGGMGAQTITPSPTISMESMSPSISFTHAGTPVSAICKPPYLSDNPCRQEDSTYFPPTNYVFDSPLGEYNPLDMGRLPSMEYCTVPGVDFFRSEMGILNGQPRRHTVATSHFESGHFIPKVMNNYEPPPPYGDLSCDETPHRDVMEQLDMPNETSSTTQLSADAAEGRCGECGKKFKGNYWPGNLKRHIKQMHLAKGLATIICRPCNKFYRRGDALRKHKWKIHGLLNCKPKKRRERNKQ